MAIGDKKPVVMESDRAVPSGIATLDSVGNVPFEQLGNVVRPNLLDNAYFVNPVNQRGQTEYYSGQVSNVYTIDRWYFSAWYRYCALTSEGLCVGSKDTDGTPIDGATSMYQLCDNLERLEGRTVTLSAILNGSLRSSTGILSKEMIALSGTASSGVVELGWSETKGMYYISLHASKLSALFQAVKLELGSTQTLAHQDADGNWVLNEIPDYGEELRKCRRYYRQSFEGADPAGKQGWCVFSPGSSNGGVAVHWDEPMRATPAVTVYDSAGVANAVKNWSGTKNPTNVTARYKTQYGFALGEDGGFVIGEMYHFHYTASADL